MNNKLLKGIITESGLKYNYLASKLNLSYYGFYKKLSGMNEFKTSEVSTLKKELNLSDEMCIKIFLDNSDTKSER